MYTAEGKVTLNPYQCIEISKDDKVAKLVVRDSYGNLARYIALSPNRAQCIELIEKLAKVAEQLPK